MSAQISDSFADLTVELGELKIPLQSLCGGTLITGATGSGKTVSVINPLTAAIAAVAEDKEDRQPAVWYFVAKGDYTQFLDSLPSHRQEDVVILRPGEDTSLSLFSRQNWHEPVQLSEAVAAILEEFSVHLHQSLDAVQQDPFWTRTRTRIISEISAAQPKEFYNVGPVDDYVLSQVHHYDHLLAVIERIEAFIEHLQGQQGENKEQQILEDNSLTPSDVTGFCDRWRTRVQSPAEKQIISLLRRTAEAASTKKKKERTRWQEFYKSLDWSSGKKIAALTRELMNLPDTTRSCITTDLMGIVSVFKTGPLGQLLAPNKTLYSIEQLIHEGKIVVIDASLTESSGANLSLQLAVKLALYSRVLGRTNAHVHFQELTRKRPIVLVIDEFQTMLSRGRTNGEDMLLSLCREFGVIVIYATQNLSLIHGVLRDSAKVDALLGNVRTQFYGFQTDPRTCEWASEQTRTSTHSTRQLAPVWHGSPKIRSLVTATEISEIPLVKPESFKLLKTGEFVVLSANQVSLLDAKNCPDSPQVRSLTN